MLLDKQVGIYMWQKAGGGLRPGDESQLQAYSVDNRALLSIYAASKATQVRLSNPACM